MKIVVTGAGGMLGSDLVAVGERMGHEVVALTHDDLDVTDPGAGRAPDRQGAPGRRGQLRGLDRRRRGRGRASARRTWSTARAPASSPTPPPRPRAKVVYLSSDYVFDGAKKRPYTEIDDTNPLNAYGRSKLAGERATALVNGRSFIVRTSWLFGTEGHNFVEEMLRLGRQGGPVVVTHDQVGSPTFTGHLAAGLLRLLDSASYGIHHMAGGGSCSWYEFANEIFRQSEVVTRVMAATSDMMSAEAKRPAYSVLGSGREAPITLPDWRRGLTDYLARREQLATLSGQEAQPPPETGEVELQEPPQAEEPPPTRASSRRQPVLPLRRTPPEELPEEEVDEEAEEERGPNEEAPR